MTAAKVPNVYKAELRERRAAAGALADDLKTALDAAARAMAAGAWQSDKAVQFEHALTAQIRVLAAAAQSVLSEFDAAIARQPDLVEPNTYEANFGRYLHLMAMDR